MFTLIKKYLKSAALACAIMAPLMMSIEVFMDLQQPTLMSDIMDRGVALGDLNFILTTGVRMIIYALIGLIGGSGCCILSCYAAVKMGGELRVKLFAKIQSLSFTELDELKTASLITRMTNDVMQIQNMFMMLLRGMVRSPLLCIGGILMSFMLSPKLAMVICVVLPVLVVLTIIIITKTIPMFVQMQSQIDRVNTVMRENLLGVRVVKAFTMEDKQFNRFSNENEALAEVSIRAQSTTFLLMPIVTLLMNLSVVSILWFGGNMEISGILASGKIMAFINYMIQITNSLVMLVNLIMNLSRAQASANRISEVFSAQPSIIDPEKHQTVQGYDITFSHVSFRYSTGDYVLKDISITLKHGQRVGIIGPTGCGKSTLVSLIPRLYDVSEGSVSIGGVDVRNIAVAELRKNVGIVLQDSILFSGSVGDNLRYGDNEADDSTIHQAAAASEAEEFIARLPDNLGAYVEQRGKNFSGGQKQRLSITRTLLQKPEILILDDSTSAVDLATEAKLQASIRKTMARSTIILIAQRISTIMDCDVILVLDQAGRLSASGVHRELIQSSELYRSITVSQLGEEAAAIA